MKRTVILPNRHRGKGEFKKRLAHHKTNCHPEALEG